MTIGWQQILRTSTLKYLYCHFSVVSPPPPSKHLLSQDLMKRRLALADISFPNVVYAACDNRLTRKGTRTHRHWQQEAAGDSQTALLGQVSRSCRMEVSVITTFWLINSIHVGKQLMVSDGNSLVFPPTAPGIPVTSVNMSASLNLNETLS